MNRLRRNRGAGGEKRDDAPSATGESRVALLLCAQRVYGFHVLTSVKMVG
jgi:hypothetical protein